MAAPVVHHVDGDDGTLTITITRGRRLAAMDRWTSASDPYCKVYYGETLVGTTSVVKSSTNPVWSDGTFECASHGAPSHKPHKAVVLELWDEDHGSADDAMGRVVVDVGHLGGLQGAMAKPKAWYDVESPTQLGKKKDWGQVEVAVAYAQGEGGGLFEGHGYMDRDVRSLRLLGTLFEECDIVIGEHDAKGVVAAHHAEHLAKVLHGHEAGGRVGRDTVASHELMIVQGRSAAQRANKAHVPQALMHIANFLEQVFPRADNASGFAFFTKKAPDGIREKLLAFEPPWRSDDPDLVKLSAHLQEVGRQHFEAKPKAPRKKHHKHHSTTDAPDGAAKPKHPRKHRSSSTTTDGDDAAKPKAAPRRKRASSTTKKTPGDSEKHHHHHHHKRTASKAGSSGPENPPPATRT